MLRRIALLAAAVGLACAQAPIRGFPADQWKAQHDREAEALAIPSSARMRIYMERMSARPHHAGSAGSKAVADYAAGLAKEWGLDAHIETFEAMLPYPSTRVVEMTAPVRFRAQLREPPLADDRETDETGLPPFNAYSASGDVTGSLVYANFGLPEDYEYLKQQHIDLKGRIVIVRYGQAWRGAKAKLAQENGAAGCLIYSDPHEDGYFVNDVYPRGPMRPAQGVQRGSVLDVMTYPGDPLSPGWASEAGSKRLARGDAKSLLKIPVQPISYGDAKPLLESLGGLVAPESWRGSLPMTYHLGPGPAAVHLKVDFDWSNKPLYDVILTIPGSMYPDQSVLYGNHHDAWVKGASDPLSAAAALLETARTLATLRQQGWQPKRTIVLALWDGEEFGLMGSTEWVEKHEAELQRKAAVYLNSDSNGRGALNVGGSHSLETFVRQVLRDVPQAKPEGEVHLYALGGGSDYVPFLNRAGVASLNAGFGGSEMSGVYHSSYDTAEWFRRFSDGDFVYGKALAQVMTAMVMRLADAPVLPFDFHTLARVVKRYADDVEREGKAVDFREVNLEIARLSAAAKAYDAALKLAPPGKLRKANEAILRVEGSLLLAEGLPGREWYRHSIYAPALYDGYDGDTLPGVREAIAARRWDEANQQARRLADALRAATAQIEAAAHELNEHHLAK